MIRSRLSILCISRSAMVVINFHLLLHNYWSLTLCWQISLSNQSFIDLYSWSNRKEKRRQRIRSFIIPDASLRMWLSSSRYWNESQVYLYATSGSPLYYPDCARHNEHGIHFPEDTSHSARRYLITRFNCFLESLFPSKGLGNNDVVPWIFNLVKKDVYR